MHDVRVSPIDEGADDAEEDDPCRAARRPWTGTNGSPPRSSRTTRSPRRGGQNCSHRPERPPSESTLDSFLVRNKKSMKVSPRRVNPEHVSRTLIYAPGENKPQKPPPSHDGTSDEVLKLWSEHGLTNATPLGRAPKSTMVAYQQGPNRAKLSQMSLDVVMTYLGGPRTLCVGLESFVVQASRARRRLRSFRFEDASSKSTVCGERRNAFTMVMYAYTVRGTSPGRCDVRIQDERQDRARGVRNKNTDRTRKEQTGKTTQQNDSLYFFTGRSRNKIVAHSKIATLPTPTDASSSVETDSSTQRWRSRAQVPEPHLPPLRATPPRTFCGLRYRVAPWRCRPASPGTGRHTQVCKPILGPEGLPCRREAPP